MSTDNIGAIHLFKLSSGPCQKGSEASRRVYQHADAVSPFVYSHWQVLPLNTPHSVEAVPGPNASHDCHSPGALSYNRSPEQSVVPDPPFESLQGHCSPDSPWTDASLDEEFLFGGLQDRSLPLSLTEDALSLPSPFLAPGLGSPPLSESSAEEFIPAGRKFSGTPASNSSVANIFPCRQSLNDRLDHEVWMPAISQLETDRYGDNDVEAILPYGIEESSCQLPHRPRRKLRSHPLPEPYFGTKPIPSLLQPFPMYATTNYFSSPPLQAAPQLRSRTTNAEGRPVQKYRCSSCGRRFTQPQVLGRHVKDMHETKESCSHCVSFTFSRGRPYVYRKHLAREHPEVASPEVQEEASRDAKESQNLGTRQAQANYVPPLNRAVPLKDMSYRPWVN